MLPSSSSGIWLLVQAPAVSRTAPPRRVAVSFMPGFPVPAGCELRSAYGVRRSLQQNLTPLQRRDRGGVARRKTLELMVFSRRACGSRQSPHGLHIGDQTVATRSDAFATETVRPRFRVPCACRIPVRAGPVTPSIRCPARENRLTPRACRGRMDPARRHLCRMDATAGHRPSGCGRGRASP